MKGIYFVSGIDTDAGKSYVTGYLARQAMDEGITTTTLKFIQTGGVGNSGFSIDIETHRKIMGIDFTDEDRSGITAPVIFSYPASPHLAAELDNRKIDYDAIKSSVNILSNKYDLLLIEGAGGLHVPLEDDYTTIDYIKDNNYPVIIATSGKLGSINHTILSLEACRTRQINVYAVVYNRFFGKDDEIIDNDTYNYLHRYIKKHFSTTHFIDKKEI